MADNWETLNDLFWLQIDILLPHWLFSSSLFSPSNLSILPVCIAGTVLPCFILIAYFWLKKACFPWLLWCRNGSRGAIHHRFSSMFLPLPPLFCANSRIPIYILAVELNYCKHLSGPSRHNRLAECSIVSVPPTG